LNLLEKIATTYEISIVYLLVEENIVFNQVYNGEITNNAYIINQLSEKLIEQYEIRLKEKDTQIVALQLQLSETK
jgi:hypothetical protein